MPFASPPWSIFQPPLTHRRFPLLALLLLAATQAATAFVSVAPVVRTLLRPQSSLRCVSRTARTATLRVLVKRAMSDSTSPSSPPAVMPLPEIQVEGILFDIDGTLFDSDPCHLAVFQELLLEEGFNNGKKIDEAFFRVKIAGRQNQAICKEFFPDWNTARAEAWSAQKEARFRKEAAGRLEAMKGLEKFMEWIEERGIKKAAVTNAPRLNAEFMLNVIDKLDWFDELIIGDECERAKPDPMPYQIAMDRLGVSPENTIVIEDSPSGAVAGAASGAVTIGILSSQPEKALLDAGCKALIRDYEDPVLWSILSDNN